MHPRLAEAAALLAEQRATLLAAYDAVPAARRAAPPEPGGWSAAGVLEHLRLVESGSARLLARRLARAREAGLSAESATGSAMGRADRETLLGAARREAPALVTPVPAVDPEAVRAGLAASRDELLALLADADGLALEQVRATHQVLGDIDFYQWLEFIALHECRHAGQLRRIAAAFAAAAPQPA